MKTRHVIVHSLFALLLLLSQQMGMAHAISHLGTADPHPSRERSLPIDAACTQCLAFAQIGSALASPDFHLIPCDATDRTPYTAIAAMAVIAGFPPYQPRAPPFPA